VNAGEGEMNEWMLIAGELNDDVNETSMMAAADDNHGL